MFTARAGLIAPGAGQPGSVYISGIAPTADYDSADTAGVGVQFTVGSFVQVGTGPLAELYRAEDVTAGAAVWNLVIQQEP